MARRVVRRRRRRGSGGVDPIEQARGWCKDYTKRRASNFYYAFAILPEAKRNAIYAAYAFSGVIDDIADELQDRAEQEYRLAEIRQRLRDCYAGIREEPLFVALGDAIDRFGIPGNLFEELMNGVEMDISVDRYATWAELYQYCYRVASMVGLICISVFGAKSSAQAEELAIDLGVALQIVNVMRDVKEDAERGRVYLPCDELSACGLSDREILAGCYDERFRLLMQRQGERAHAYFERGRQLLPLLDMRSRMCVNVLQGIYAEILKRIEERDYDVLTERVRLSGREKIWSIGKLWTQAAAVRAA
jgi:15-cis-phytoene synthase